jgi:hypothetical protein
MLRIWNLCFQIRLGIHTSRNCICGQNILLYMTEEQNTLADNLVHCLNTVNNYDGMYLVRTENFQFISKSSFIKETLLLSTFFVPLMFIILFCIITGL